MPWQGQGSVTHGFLSLMNGCSAELARAEESGLALFSAAAVSARTVTEDCRRAALGRKGEVHGEWRRYLPFRMFPRP